MTVTDNLIALKVQYEGALENADTNAGQYQEQLTHINALLLDLLLQNRNGSAPTAIWEASVPLTTITSAQGYSATQPKTKAIATKASNSRISLPYLPAFEGKKKLEAISQAFDRSSGGVLHQDEIIETLYGDLSPADLKAERLRMKTALYQGVQKKLWQKAAQPSTYTLKSAQGKTVASVKTPATAKLIAVDKGSKPKSPPKTPAPKPIPTPSHAIAKKGKPAGTGAIANTAKMIGAKPILPMHEDFAGLSKIDAVLKAMQENAGKTVHIDALIERLYGDLSVAEAKAEKGRMKDVMSRGRERGLWQKAREPLSFITGKATTASSKPMAPKKGIAKGRSARTK